MTAINLDTYSLSLLTAKEDILNDRNSTNWAIFTYEKLWNLKLADSGAGGLEDLVQKLSDRSILYGLCRMMDPNNQTPRILLINWVGEQVDESRRDICKDHLPAIKHFFKEAHVLVSARQVEELSQDKVFELLSKTAQPGRTPRKSFVPGSHQVVGSTYRKTNPAIEMKFSKRESFWERSEREEERRKEEERIRMLEDRISWEKQRVERERAEEEERERLIREKEKLVDEKRKEMAQLEAEQRRLEKARWAQQQRDYEEEIKGKYRRSQSIEMAAEAAALVSGRSLHPRDFFRQQERSVSCSYSPPSTPSSPSRFAPGVPHKPAFRYQRSLTESVLSHPPQSPSYVSNIYKRDLACSPSPVAPKPLSPAFIFSKSALPVTSPKVESLPSFIPPPIVPTRAGSLQYRNISPNSTSPRSFSKETVTVEESRATHSLPPQATPSHLFASLKPDFDSSVASDVFLPNDTYKAELVPITTQSTEDPKALHTPKTPVWAEKVDVIQNDNVTSKTTSSHIALGSETINYITTSATETPLNDDSTKSILHDATKEATRLTAFPTTRSNLYNLPLSTDTGVLIPPQTTSDTRLHSAQYPSGNTHSPVPKTTNDTSLASPATTETILPLFVATRVDIRSPSPATTEDVFSTPPPTMEPVLPAYSPTTMDTLSGTPLSTDATTIPLLSTGEVMLPQCSHSVEALPSVALKTEAIIPPFQPSKDQPASISSPTPLSSLLNFVSPSPYTPFRSDSIRHTTSRLDRSAFFSSISESPQLNASVSPSSEVNLNFKDQNNTETLKSPTSIAPESFNDVDCDTSGALAPTVTRTPSSDSLTTATSITFTVPATDILTTSPTTTSQTLSIDTLTTPPTAITNTSPTTTSQTLSIDTLTNPSTGIMKTSPTTTSQTLSIDTLTTPPTGITNTSPTTTSQTLSIDTLTTPPTGITNTSPTTTSQTLSIDTLTTPSTAILTTSPTTTSQTLSMDTLTTPSTGIMNTSPTTTSQTLSIDTLTTPSTVIMTTSSTEAACTPTTDILTAPSTGIITSTTDCTLRPSKDTLTSPSSGITATSPTSPPHTPSTDSDPATERPRTEKATTPLTERLCTNPGSATPYDSKCLSDDNVLLFQAPPTDNLFLIHLSATDRPITSEFCPEDNILSSDDPNTNNPHTCEAAIGNIIPFQDSPTYGSLTCETPPTENIVTTETTPTCNSLMCELSPIDSLLPIDVSYRYEAHHTGKTCPTDTPPTSNAIIYPGPSSDDTSPVTSDYLACEASFTDDVLPAEPTISHSLLTNETPPTDNAHCFEVPPTDKVIPQDVPLVDKILLIDSPPTDSLLVENLPTYKVIPTESAPTNACEAPPTANAHLDEATAADSSYTCEGPSTDTLSDSGPPSTICSMKYKTPPTDNILSFQAPPTDKLLLEVTPTDSTVTSEAPPTDKIISFEDQPTDRSIVLEAPPTDKMSFEDQPTDRSIVLEAPPTDKMSFEDQPTDGSIVLEAPPTDNSSLLDAPLNILSLDTPIDDFLMFESTPIENTQCHRMEDPKETPYPQTSEPRCEAEIHKNIGTVEMQSVMLSDITAHANEDLLDSGLLPKPLLVTVEDLLDSDVTEKSLSALPPGC